MVESHFIVHVLVLLCLCIHCQVILPRIANLVTFATLLTSLGSQSKRVWSHVPAMITSVSAWGGAKTTIFPC